MSRRFNPFTLPVANGVTPVHGFWAEDDAVLALGDGAEVTSWVNRGSNGTAATGTTGTVPTLVLDGINGRPALNFDGVDNRLTIPRATVTVAQPGTVVVAYQRDDTSTLTRFISGEQTAGRWLLSDHASLGYGLFAGVTLRETPPVGVAGEPEIVVATVNGASSELRISGALSASGDAGTGDLQGISIGAGGANDDHLNGKIAAVFVFDQDVTGLPWFREWELGLRGHYQTDTVPQPAAGIGRVFDPLAYGAPLWRFWAEDPDWAPPADGGDVTSWRDSGSDGADLTNVNINEPTYVASEPTLNGRPAINLGTGVARVLANTTATDITGASTLVAVCSPTNANPGVLADSTNSGGRRFVRDSAGTGLWRMQMSAAADTSAAIRPNRANVIAAVFNATSSKFYLDGTLTDESLNPGTSTHVDGLTVGATFAGSQAFDGFIAFLAVFDSDISGEGWFDNFILGLRAHYGVL